MGRRWGGRHGSSGSHRPLRGVRPAGREAEGGLRTDPGLCQGGRVEVYARRRQEAGWPAEGYDGGSECGGVTGSGGRVTADKDPPSQFHLLPVGVPQLCDPRRLRCPRWSYSWSAPVAVSAVSLVFRGDASSLQLTVGTPRFVGAEPVGTPRLWEQSPRTTPELVAAGRTSEGQSGLNGNCGGAGSHGVPQRGVSQGLPAGGAPGAWGPSHRRPPGQTPASAAPRPVRVQRPRQRPLPRRLPTWHLACRSHPGPHFPPPRCPPRGP